MFKSKLACFLLFTTLLLVACKKEKSLVGDVTIDVSSVKTWSDMTYKDVQPEIFSSENSEYPLFKNLTIDSNGIIHVKGLLVGNYIFKFNVKWDSSNDPTKPGKAFQIKANEETNLVIDYQKDWNWQ